MKIRAYHADSVESAIRQARRELGPEAMLLDSRQVSAEARRLGAYEVRFAFAGGAAAEDPAENLDQLYRRLTEAELDPELAAEFTARLIPYGGQGATARDLENHLLEAIRERVPVAPRLGRSGAAPQVAALVGPAGAGKTTTIAKLAVQFGLQQRRRVHLITMDCYRVGAAGEMHTLAAILGLDGRAVEEVSQLELLLPEFPAPDLVLIDTPGAGFQDLDRSAGLAGFLSRQENIDVHLVLSASTRPQDLRRLEASFAGFGPRKLLFTKLDETLSYGSLLNEAIRTRWPLSFLGTGQRIPEDLQPATGSAVAELLLGRRPRAAAR